MAVIEVRDYHYDQERMDRYRTWAIEAGSYLRELWDMSGFWLELGGGAPSDRLGSEGTSPWSGQHHVGDPLGLHGAKRDGLGRLVERAGVG